VPQRWGAGASVNRRLKRPRDGSASQVRLEGRPFTVNAWTYGPRPLAAIAIVLVPARTVIDGNEGLATARPATPGIAG
jgi:hypothetical protein